MTNDSASILLGILGGRMEMDRRKFMKMAAIAAIGAGVKRPTRKITYEELRDCYLQAEKMQISREFVVARRYTENGRQ